MIQIQLTKKVAHEPKMEMNVCNANTNWLRGEHDCTKDSKKMTKRGEKKKDLESRLRLDCRHNKHVRMFCNEVYSGFVHN